MGGFIVPVVTPVKRYTFDNFMSQLMNISKIFGVLTENAAVTLYVTSLVHMAGIPTDRLFNVLVKSRDHLDSFYVDIVGISDGDVQKMIGHFQKYGFDTAAYNPQWDDYYTVQGKQQEAKSLRFKVDACISSQLFGYEHFLRGQFALRWPHLIAAQIASGNVPGIPFDRVVSHYEELVSPYKLSLHYCDALEDTFLKLAGVQKLPSKTWFAPEDAASTFIYFQMVGISNAEAMQIVESLNAFLKLPANAKSKVIYAGSAENFLAVDGHGVSQPYRTEKILIPTHLFMQFSDQFSKKLAEIARTDRACIERYQILSKTRQHLTSNIILTIDNIIGVIKAELTIKEDTLYVEEIVKNLKSYRLAIVRWERSDMQAAILDLTTTLEKYKIYLKDKKNEIGALDFIKDFEKSILYVQQQAQLQPDIEVNRLPYYYEDATNAKPVDDSKHSDLKAAAPATASATAAAPASATAAASASASATAAAPASATAAAPAPTLTSTSAPGSSVVVKDVEKTLATKLTDSASNAASEVAATSNPAHLLSQSLQTIWQGLPVAAENAWVPQSEYEEGAGTTPMTMTMNKASKNN